VASLCGALIKKICGILRIPTYYLSDCGKDHWFAIRVSVGSNCQVDLVRAGVLFVGLYQAKYSIRGALLHPTPPGSVYVCVWRGRGWDERVGHISLGEPLVTYAALEERGVKCLAQTSLFNAIVQSPSKLLAQAVHVNLLLGGGARRERDALRVRVASISRAIRYSSMNRTLYPFPASLTTRTVLKPRNLLLC
jgi:hypothetical protein